MLRENDNTPKAMEFTVFSKARGVKDEDLINAVMQFEKEYITQQEGVIFHCLVRNLNGDYANLVFADDMGSLKNLPKGFMDSDVCKQFLECVDKDTVKMHHHTIMKDNFVIPDNFACFEHGTFVIKKDIGFTEDKMLTIADTLEKQYLNDFDNSRGHFMGKLDDETYSELAFGRTLGKTREICYGYFGVDAGLQLMDLYDPESTELNFWYLIA